MKKIFSALGAVAAVLGSCFGEVRADAPIMTFGLVSDVHLGGEGKDADLENVLRHFDAQGVDAVMIPGDIAHSGLIAEFERFAAIWYKVFPNDRGADGRKVERLIVGGNHCIDGWPGRWKGWSEERLRAERFNYADNPQKTWRRLFNEDWQEVFVKTVKGIPFVGAQWKSEQAPFLKPPLAETVAKLAPTFDTKLPFFIFQHNAPAGTCFGKAGDAELAAALRPHPNAVSVSGHYHRSVADDRNIWQGEFTALSAGCLHEAAGGEGYRNVNYHWHAPSRTKPMRTTEWISRGGCCSVVEVFADRLVVHRRSVQTSEPLGEDWVVPIPAVAGKGFDFKVREKETVAPEFAADAKVTVTYCPKGHPEQAARYAGKPCVAVTFPAAQTPNGVVREYEVVAARQDGRELVRTTLMPNAFGLPKARMNVPGVCLFKPDELNCDQQVVFSVIPKECFGKAGRPLRSEPFGSCFGEVLQIRQGSDGGLSFPGGELSAHVFLPGWESARVACDWDVRADGARTFALKDALGVLFAGTSHCEVVESGVMDCEISLVCVRECALESVCLSYTGAYAPVSGRNWKADERQLTLPEKQGSSVFLADGRAGCFELPLPKDEFLRLEFPGKVSYYAQDSRQWGSNWSLRLGGRGGSFTCQKGERFSWKFRISSAHGIEFRQDRPYEIRKGDVWAPLRNPRNIVPGSALDFSAQGLQDAPAGKYGWLKSSGGHFEFAGRPGVAQRFYGVNLCFTANYLDHSHADELIDRLVRFGYNSIRIHHHDDLWRDPVRQDRLDYLVSRAIAKGLYITTDLYVSRKVRWREIGLDREGEVNTQLFKSLVTCYEPAYRNWCDFAREFLEHVNPYTGRAYKDEPGMPLISLVNEGMLGMNWGKSGKPTDERIHAAWREFGGKGPMPAPGNAAFVRFDDWLAERFLKRAIPFLRDLGVKALLTNDNNGGRHREGESNTRFYDYVDNHFYVDHPEFLDTPWRPPSRCPNENPILAGEPKIFSRDLTRGASRPYVISEWNFSGPGRYRALGGLLTGATSSIQGWDGLWRFAYSHSDSDVMPPERCQPGLFDCATDPLIQASDRASVCLFLRQDLSEGDEASYSADKSTGSLRIVTTRTCGGFASAGRIDAGPLRAEITGAPATVWVSSVDGKPIAASDRLLLTHLTDVQAEGNRYADETRKVILKWGRGGVIERGEASIELQVDSPEGLAVHELDTAGNRTGEVPSEVRDGRLTFSVSTHGPRGGRIYYEIVRTTAPSADKPPFLTMRLRANDTESLATWRTNFSAVASHPGCCDEIWFSTGCGAPALDWHRANAAVLAEAVKDCRAKGIVPSLQFQATLGHGDNFGTPELFAMKSWTGWTGPTGVETKYCNCPRQPAFLAYLREVSKIYAPLGFGSLWIDDDLRIEHHQPSESYGRRAGCWCATCLAEFNAATGAKWTRSALAQAVATNEVAAARWRAFQVDAICTVAKTVGEVFHELSPGTMLGYQHAGYEGVAEPVNAVLKTLHETSGRAVGSRPGGGSYYDDNPNEMVLKSLKSGWFRARLGDPDYVSVWTPEIESWPRTYYSRSPQGVLVEGFTALMYGMNAVSFFISNGAMEDPALYGRTHWKTLAAAAPALRGYARMIEGCRPVGFTIPGKPQIGIRRAAIPVLSGIGRSFGELTKGECALDVNTMTSAAVQKLRDDLDRRAGGLPAVIRSPFEGLMQVHVDAENRPAAVALLNTRITAQGPVRVELRRLPEGVRTVTWQALCRAPERLPVERTGNGGFVTIPEIGAWNGGYLDLLASLRGHE